MRAGAPAAMEKSGRSDVTTELAPITQWRPIRMFPTMTQWAPIH